MRVRGARPFAPYLLLRDVNGNLALPIVVLAAASVPPAFPGKAHDLDALTWLGGSDHLQALTPEHSHARVMR